MTLPAKSPGLISSFMNATGLGSSLTRLIPKVHGWKTGGPFSPTLTTPVEPVSGTHRFRFGTVCDDLRPEQEEAFTVEAWTTRLLLPEDAATLDRRCTRGTPKCEHRRIGNPISRAILINDNDDGPDQLMPPTGIDVTNGGEGQLLVRWTSPTSPPDHYFVGYRLQTPGGGSDSGTTWTPGPSVPGTGTEVTLSGLQDGSPYLVIVCSQRADDTPVPPTDGNPGQYCVVGQGTPGEIAQPPTVGTQLPNLELGVGQTAKVLLDGAFVDPDPDDPGSRSSVLTTVVVVLLTNLVLLAVWRVSSAWRRRIGIGLVVLVAATPAQAQTDWHVYGGGVLGGNKEKHIGALVGAGASVGYLYGGADIHGLDLNAEGQAELQALAAGTGIDLTYEAYGADGVIGFVGRRPGALIIPALVFGYTTGEAEGCIAGADCLRESVGQVNYGFEIIAAATGNTGSGIRASYRYGRNYGNVLSIGWMF